MVSEPAFGSQGRLTAAGGSGDGLAPLLIGFILGGMMEDNFARSMQLYDGVAFIWERPMTLGLLVIAVILVLLPSYRARRAKARSAGVAEGD